MFKMKKIAAIVTAVVMAASIGSITASAEPLPVEEPIEIVLTAGDVAIPYSSTIPVSYNCSSVQDLGRFVASTSTVYLEFGEPSVGAVAIKFHTGSADGPVIKTILPPPAGTTATTLRTSFSVTRGTTYYITAEPTSGYLSTRGSFTITY